MNEELPSNLRPSKAVPEDRELVEEVVSSVQPRKSRFTRQALERGALVALCIFAAGYLIVVDRNWFSVPVKVANAPEGVISGLQMPVHTGVVSLPLPAVVENPYQPQLVQPRAVIDETVPTPRISSTFTNEPSVATKPTPPAQVAGTSVQVSSPRTYMSTQGFSFRVPISGTVKEVEQGRTIVVDARGKIVSEVVVLPASTLFTTETPPELALSTNISDIRRGVLGSDVAFFYRVNATGRGMYVLHGTNAYYITDYTNSMLQTFTVHP